MCFRIKCCKTSISKVHRSFARAQSWPQPWPEWWLTSTTASYVHLQPVLPSPASSAQLIKLANQRQSWPPIMDTHFLSWSEWPNIGCPWIWSILLAESKTGIVFKELSQIWIILSQCLGFGTRRALVIFRTVGFQSCAICEAGKTLIDVVCN